MNQTAKKIEELSIVSLTVDEDSLTATISDGRRVSIPVAWFPRLESATLDQLKHFEISPSGYGIHWPDVDEDISIKAFINP
ncbi:MAG: hypothetical protein COV44_03590 [Deltaproteobacteria bacterium CG11_big_fil_rev_8_21_14_0_20_45_16]|nr:MAG: hypothetical protein COV44_03590 [Deltaproteobacteria bacterium CG11_big_fil_rev_8_21_14_0_20_45_16]